MNKIIKTLKHIFIPHEHNDYKPHFFRELSVGIIAIVLVVLFSISAGTKLYINNNDMTAAVLPAVLVDLTNDARKSNGSITLSRSSILDEAARLKANDMVTYGYFAHTSPLGITPWHWFSKTNYNFSYAGENLAIDFSESIDVEKAWLASPTHKANILNNNFTEIGIATKEGYYNGHRTTYVVQMFGKPTSSNVSKVNEVESKEVAPKISEVKIKYENVTLPKLAINPIVKGEVIETIKNTDNLEIIKEDNEFISVKNNSILEKTDVIVPSATEKYSKWHQRFLFLAPLYANIIYKIIIFVILLALILTTIIEIKRQHPKNIIYGILLLIIIFCLIYVNRSIFVIDFLV